MRCAFVVVQFCLDASVRPSLIELSPGQRTVSEYSSTVRKHGQVDQNTNPLQFWEARRVSKPHTSAKIKFTSNFDPMEQWSEFKVVELWQPANNNIGAAYVCSPARSVQTSNAVAHSCRTVLVFIHPQHVNKKADVKWRDETSAPYEQTSLARKSTPRNRSSLIAVRNFQRVSLGIQSEGYKKAYLKKKNQNAPRPSEHPPVRGKKCQNVQVGSYRLQIQNLFMAVKRVPLYGSNIGSTV